VTDHNDSDRTYKAVDSGRTYKAVLPDRGETFGEKRGQEMVVQTPNFPPPPADPPPPPPVTVTKD